MGHQSIEALAVTGFVLGVATSIAWLVIAWRAMRVLERIADAIDGGAFKRP